MNIMDKGNKKTTINKVSSRNRNKNKNKSLQNKAKEKILEKKAKSKKLGEVIVIDEKPLVSKNTEKEEVVVISDKTIIDKPLRDTIVVVPERKEISFVDEGYTTVEVNDFSFVDSNSSDDKFKFVEYEEDFVDTFKEELEEFNEYNPGSVEEVNSVLDIEEVFSNDVINPVVEDLTLDNANYFDETEAEEVEEYLSVPTSNVDINARKHISFEKRVAFLVLLVIIFFFVAGLFIFKAVTHTNGEKVTFDEVSTVDYKVCLNQQQYGQYYEDSCLDEGMEYLTSLSEKMPVTFNYNVSYSDSVDIKLNYYVTSKVNIYREKNGRVINTTEDVLVERTSYDVFGNYAEFLIDVDVPLKKYIDYVNSYNNQFGISSYALLEVMFYVDNGNTIKKVSSLSLPLTNATYGIDKMVVTNSEQNLNIVDDSWGSVNTSYAVVGLIFVLFGLLAIIKLADLIYKVMTSSSLYQRKLNRIMREYDREIVISRNGYTLDDSKKLVKVTSFSELLDARDTLEKPIVYVRVNNVKSEFYVEDSETIYKYTMKEADFEGR